MNKVYLICSNNCSYYDETTGQFRGFIFSTYYDKIEDAEKVINDLHDKSFTFLEIKQVYIPIK